MIRRIHAFWRFSAPFHLAVFAGLATLLLAPVSKAQESIVQLDPAQTKIEYALSGNFHTVHGTFALKSSTIRFGPARDKVAIEIQAAGRVQSGGNP